MQSVGSWFICIIKVYYLSEIQECTVQYVMIDILRVKIKVTLCMLDKFSYCCHLYHVQFNIKTILGTSPVRLFCHVWSGFKLLQARNLFVSLSGQTDLLKLYARALAGKVKFICGQEFMSLRQFEISRNRSNTIRMMQVLYTCYLTPQNPKIGRRFFPVWLFVWQSNQHQGCDFDERPIVNIGSSQSPWSLSIHSMCIILINCFDKFSLSN